MARTARDAARVPSAATHFAFGYPGASGGDLRGAVHMAALQYAVDSSFKLFWDGEISSFVDTERSSDNNKQFLNHILEMR